MELVKGLNTLHQEWLKELGFISLEKMHRDDLITLHLPERRLQPGGVTWVGHFSQVLGDTWKEMEENSLKLCQMRFR